MTTAGDWIEEIIGQKSARIIFLTLFRLLFLKTSGFLQVTKDKFCKVENKHCTHIKNLTRRAVEHIAKTADLVTADKPLGEPLGPASHADLLRGYAFLMGEEDSVTSQKNVCLAGQWVGGFYFLFPNFGFSRFRDCGFIHFQGSRILKALRVIKFEP